MTLPWLKNYKHSAETKLKIGDASRGKFKIKNELDIQRIMNMYADGKSACYIARLHDVDQKTICSLLRRNGVTMIKNRGVRTGKCQWCHKPVTTEDLDRHLLKRGIWRCRTHERTRGKSKNRQLKLEMIEAYGRICVCCGESRMEFLSIDHINGGGRKHVRGLGSHMHLYSWLKRHKFPKDEFRLLCYNCNMSRGFFGYCPHTKS